MDSIDFLKSIFGTNEGFLFISTKAADNDAEITIHKPFMYPESLPTIKTYLAMRDDQDVYFSPMLFSVPRRRTSAVKHTSVLYADTDRFPIDQFEIAPSINVETSPGRHASFWLLDEAYDPEAVAAASRAIALTHASNDEQGRQTGTDPGGWDLTQLLRMPNSTNLKYLVPGKYSGYTQPYKVFVDDKLSPMNVYSLAEITTAYDPENLPAMPQRASMDMPDLETLPESKDVLRRVMASRNLATLYEKKAGYGEDRSQVLYHFICECLRAGLTPEETFVAAWYSASNKYRIDGRPRDDLWSYDMRKALADPTNRPRPTVDEEASEYLRPKDAGISTEVEFALLREDEIPTHTFINDYVEWASSKTDAPTAYHIASAMTVLSCVFGQYVVATPKYGDLNLGLSFVIMGETTETRKSTARNLMKQLLRSLQDEEYTYLLTSDATEEALIDALCERPGLTSVYDRDEAQKLISDVKGGKGYMKGFLETLNELYDGYARGRLRTNKQTQEANVVFIQYLMGIRSQIQDNLELSDFASGWGPRNIYVRGESPARTRENSLLEQQPKVEGDTVPDELMERLTSDLRALRARWKRKAGTGVSRMRFTDEAWERMANLEFDLIEFFDGHPRSEILRPCLQRLFTNALKLATLFAAARGVSNAELEDVINTRFYAAQWVEDLLIMVEGVNESIYARDIKNLEKWIASKGGLVTNAAAITWNVDNGKSYREHMEMVKVLEDRNVIVLVEDAKNKLSLRLIGD